jgi:hypothetical protein
LSTEAFGAQPSVATSSEFEKRIQPIIDWHAPTMVNIQWGLTINCNYTKEIANFHTLILCSIRVCIHKRQDRVEHSHNVIRIQKAHPAHYGWPCANNG